MKINICVDEEEKVMTPPKNVYLVGITLLQEHNISIVSGLEMLFENIETETILLQIKDIQIEIYYYYTKDKSKLRIMDSYKGLNYIHYKSDKIKIDVTL